MTDALVESLADEVVSAFRLTVPIDLYHIALEESIEMIEGEFGEEFHGRIEYLAEVGVFAIYHPAHLTSQYPSRVRFSIGHELGHYYIPHHRDMLLQGKAHYSLEGFRHKSSIERQADTFAAALLIPTKILVERMGRRKFLSLSQILNLADTCRASVQATAFRYTRFTTEPHLALISEHGKVLYGFASEEAHAWGFGGFRDLVVPASSPTFKATAGNGIHEGRVLVEMWFPERNPNAALWEEAIRLGNSNRILTLLSWIDYGK